MSPPCDSIRSSSPSSNVDGVLIGWASRVRSAGRWREQTLGLSDTDEVIINLGRQEYAKGQDDLLRATARLAQDRPSLVLLIAGREGHSSSSLRALAGELGIANRVRFLGFREDVGDLLAASDVFAFPSLYEGLGGAVLEAMALSLPIVATRIGPLEEVLDEGRNARLVEVHDPIGVGMRSWGSSTTQCNGTSSQRVAEQRLKSASHSIEVRLAWLISTRSFWYEWAARQPTCQAYSPMGTSLPFGSDPRFVRTAPRQPDPYVR